MSYAVFVCTGCGYALKVDVFWLQTRGRDVACPACYSKTKWKKAVQTNTINDIRKKLKDPDLWRKLILISNKEKFNRKCRIIKKYRDYYEDLDEFIKKNPKKQELRGTIQDVRVVEE